MLVGDNVQPRPIDGDTVSVKETVPEKPWMLATAIVEVAAIPALVVTLMGLAVMAKSWTVYTTSAVCPSVPFVPVTRTSSFWPDENVQESMALPEPVMLIGVIVQEVLLVARLTMLAKPLTAPTVMVEVPAEFALTVTLVGFAVRLKSCTTKVTVTEWESDALVPVTVTLLLPVDVNLHERVEFPGLVTLVGLRLQEELFDVRLTVPAKPVTAPMMMVDVPVVLMLTSMLEELAAIVKSWTATVTFTEWIAEPLVPVTRTCLIPVELNVHVSVEVPAPVTLVGERVHEVLFVDRLMWPLNPFTAVIVIVEVP
jgi:hypothetical protein